tara:strand:+ start:325 stop:555 length:231 start_codon:yes stop_codon:yes gene_type:complete
MSDEPIKLVTNDKLLEPDAVLERAKDVFTHVVVLGWDKSETLDVRASSNLSNEQAIYIMELAKHTILQAAIFMEDD